jgi:hypothetical protein
MTLMSSYELSAKGLKNGVILPLTTTYIANGKRRVTWRSQELITDRDLAALWGGFFAYR